MTTFKAKPESIAFDFDGVVADTMGLFLDIARQEYRINNIRYEDIVCYRLEDCVAIERDIIEAILKKVQDGDYAIPLRPFEGASRVLSRLGQNWPVSFVTARPYVGPIQQWILDLLPLDASSIRIFATGSFEGKTDVLLDNRISYFVEDRLETCFTLHEADVKPILFAQPWNRQPHPFVEVRHWDELETLIDF